MKRPTASGITLAMGIALAAGGACSHEVKPDSMSAAQHEQQADIDTAKASTEVARSTRDSPPLPNPTAMPGSNPQGYYYPVDSYNPSTEHLARARQLEEHAREHRAAAAKLEAYTQAECRGFPPETRASCPMLGPVQQIEDIKGGVRVRFTPQTRVDAVAEHMRCHFVYAQQYGFDTVEGCPLYVKGLEITVSADGKAIDLTSHDARTVDAIRARTREEAILVRQ